MLMHPKPAKRHTQYARQLKDVQVKYDLSANLQFVITFKTQENATQSLFMTEKEAFLLYKQIASMLRYRDTCASDIDENDFRDFNATLEGALKGIFS